MCRFLRFSVLGHGEAFAPRLCLSRRTGSRGVLPFCSGAMSRSKSTAAGSRRCQVSVRRGGLSETRPFGTKLRSFLAASFTWQPSVFDSRVSAETRCREPYIGLSSQSKCPTRNTDPERLGTRINWAATLTFTRSRAQLLIGPGLWTFSRPAAQFQIVWAPSCAQDLGMREADKARSQCPVAMRRRRMAGNVLRDTGERSGARQTPGGRRSFKLLLVEVRCSAAAQHVGGRA